MGEPDVPADGHRHDGQLPDASLPDGSVPVSRGPVERVGRGSYPVRPDRDPIALAAWRRVAEQRNRRRSGSSGTADSPVGGSPGGGSPGGGSPADGSPAGGSLADGSRTGGSPVDATGHGTPDVPADAGSDPRSAAVASIPGAPAEETGPSPTSVVSFDAESASLSGPDADRPGADPHRSGAEVGRPGADPHRSGADADRPGLGASPPAPTSVVSFDAGHSDVGHSDVGHSDVGRSDTASIAADAVLEALEPISASADRTGSYDLPTPPDGWTMSPETSPSGRAVSAEAPLTGAGATPFAADGTVPGRMSDPPLDPSPPAVSAVGPSLPGSPWLGGPLRRDGQAADDGLPPLRPSPTLSTGAAGRSPGPGAGQARERAGAEAGLGPGGGAGGGDAPGGLHDALLGLAGRIDDDALSSVRELVAVEDDAEAAELLGGCLLAAGAALTAGERSVLGAWFATARVDPDLVGALPDDPDATRRTVHRFVSEPAGAGAGVVVGDAGDTVARAAARLPGVTSVRQSWRTTPAGSTPGPLPHRVVLVETDSADDQEHVAHHVAHAARDLGAVSVEVFAAGAALPTYHRDALAASVLLHGAPEVTAPPTWPAPSTPSRDVRSDGDGWSPGAGTGRSALDGDPEPERWRTVADALPAGLRADDEDDRWEPVAEADTRRGEVGDDPAAGPRSERTGREPVSYADRHGRNAASSPEGDGAVSADREGRDDSSYADRDGRDLQAAPDQAGEPWPPEDRPEPPGGRDENARSSTRPEAVEDEDPDRTAERIAALWRTPSSVDAFEAPLPDGLEPTALEPDGSRWDEPFGGSDPSDPAEDLLGDRHGDAATWSAGAGTRSSSPLTGPLPLPGRDADDRSDATSTPPFGLPLGDTVGLGDRAPGDEEPPRVARARHSRAAPDDDDLPELVDGPGWSGGDDPLADPDEPERPFGHDARYGAGTGPAWPGGPIGPARPGAEEGHPVPSPIDVGAGRTNGHRHGPTNGHRHDAPAGRTNGHDHGSTNGHEHDAPVGGDTPTGPVTWPAWTASASANGRSGGTSGLGAEGRPAGVDGGRSGEQGRPIDQERSGEQDRADDAGWPGDTTWSADTEEAVAQLSDRERELLARLHEELASRERGDGGPHSPATGIPTGLGGWSDGPADAAPPWTDPGPYTDAPWSPGPTSAAGPSSEPTERPGPTSGAGPGLNAGGQAGPGNGPAGDPGAPGQVGPGYGPAGQAGPGYGPAGQAGPGYGPAGQAGPGYGPAGQAGPGYGPAGQAGPGYGPAGQPGPGPGPAGQGGRPYGAPGPAGQPGGGGPRAGGRPDGQAAGDREPHDGADPDTDHGSGRAPRP